MTLSARLTTPAAGDPDLRVAGMSVLLRQLLSLQDAGITEVVLPTDLIAAIPTDPRLHLRLVSDAEPPSGGAAEPPILTAPVGLVWHRMLPRRLVQAGYRGDLLAAPREAGEFVVAVTDAASARAATDRLFAALLKATDGIISRRINRRISLQVTRRLIDTGLTPNQMTVIALAIGLAGIGGVLWWGAGWLVPGALLLQTQSILDGCDGEISRLKYIRSRLGEWLDQVGDDVVNVGFFAAASWVLWRDGSTLAGWLGLVGTVLHLAYQVALYAALVFRGGGSGSITSIRWWGQKDHVAAPAGAGGPFRLLKETVEMAGRRDFFTFLYLPAALVGMTEIALVWCAIIFSVSGLTTGLQWLLRGGPEPAARTS
ncbi:MAG: CDP-alcohol phosphatidyltransferase family protein [Gemmatimonadota bacterium]|nr:CDP-alcohol phosphatidyltransferase family protein [Gemmatimonadota bacterium]